MVKPAEARQGDDLGGGIRLQLHDSHRGRVLLQGQVRSIVEVVRGEAGQKALQVLLVEDDDVIQEIATCSADEPLGDPVLPGAASGDLLWFDAHVVDRGEDLVSVLGVTVEDQEARCSIVGERLAELLRDPGCRRMGSHTQVHQLAPGVVDDEEDIKHAERDGGNREEVDRGDDLAVVGEEGAPSLPFVGMGRAPGHEARNRALGDLEAELQDLAVDARRTPRRVLGGHPANEDSDLGCCARSSSAGPRLPAPVPPEALAMPADDGLGLDDGERLLPSRPAAAQDNPEDAIGRAETRPRLLPLEDSELLSEREVLQDQVGPSGEEREEGLGDGHSMIEHPRTMTAVGAEDNRCRGPATLDRSRMWFSPSQGRRKAVATLTQRGEIERSGSTATGIARRAAC